MECKVCGQKHNHLDPPSPSNKEFIQIEGCFRTHDSNGYPYDQEVEFRRPSDTRWGRPYSQVWLYACPNCKTIIMGD